MEPEFYYRRPKTLSYYRPDIIWKKPDGSYVVIEISVPRDGRAAIVRNEKRERYAAFVADLKRVRRRPVDFIPVVIGATGVVSDEMEVSLNRLGIRIELSWLQKIATTETTKFIRDLIYY